MENQVKTEQGITLTQKEAEEYCAYKRQKKICEITSAMRRAESILTANDVATTVCHQATRLRQNAVRMTPVEMLQRGEFFFKSPVGVDCIVGGNGETLAKVKAYETRLAIRAGAKEITLLLSPTQIAACRYSEIRKEIKRVRRAARKAVLKVRVDKNYPQATLSRLARLSAEGGAQYFSLPYFKGCEVLQAELSGGCLLEVSGIEKLSDYKQTVGAGMGRILTSHAWEMYTEWLKEVEKITLENTVQGLPTQEKREEEIEEKKEEKTMALALPIALPPPASERIKS